MFNIGNFRIYLGDYRIFQMRDKSQFGVFLGGGQLGDKELMGWKDM